MPNGTGLNPRVEHGEICAKCGVEFDGAHGQPVLCHTCYGEPNNRNRLALPKAWLEEKAP